MPPPRLHLLGVGALASTAAATHAPLPGGGGPQRELFPEPLMGGWASPCEPSEDAASLPFCDPALDLESRIADLVGRLDLGTAAPQLMANTVRAGIALAGTSTTLPSYEWSSEALHGLGRCSSHEEGQEISSGISSGAPIFILRGLLFALGLFAFFFFF
jgi:hypothetical protein